MAVTISGTTGYVDNAGNVRQIPQSGAAKVASYTLATGDVGEFIQVGTGGAAVTNTAGSISAQVSANPTAGFSVATYTGTGANATVGHGLGVAPKMIIFKRRDSTSNWPTYHASTGNTGGLYLNGTNAFTTGVAFWNNTSPTSTVFTLGAGNEVNVSTATNVSGATYVYAAFAENPFKNSLAR